MGIKITQSDLDSQRDLVIESLYRFLTPQSDARRFDWLYTSNVSGAAKAWLAIDEQQGRVVGMAAAFPRRFYFGGSEIVTWVLGDFCLDVPYRSLGPALQLQRACLEGTAANSETFCYDFPSASMGAVYKRLGILVTGKMLRLAKLLRVDRKVRQIVKFPLADRAVATVGNMFLKALPRPHPTDSSVELSLHQGLYDEDFSNLAKRLRGRFDVCIQRSTEYLNWRYVRNPLAVHECITARRDGQLVGYAVFSQEGQDAMLVDLFGEEDPMVTKGLVNDVADRMAKRGVMTLSVWLSDGHPWLSLYTDMGFRVRDSAPIVWVPSPSFANTVDLRTAKWFLMQGDRDS